MSEENKIEFVEKKECFCQSKWVRKFLVTAIGTFIGVFSALSLFAALHKPPVPPCHCPRMMRPPVHQMHHQHRHYGHINKGHRGDFYRKIEKTNFDRKVPERVEVKR
jgi:hypothetical protein